MILRQRGHHFAPADATSASGSYRIPLRYFQSLHSVPIRRVAEDIEPSYVLHQYVTVVHLLQALRAVTQISSSFVHSISSSSLRFVLLSFAALSFSHSFIRSFIHSGYFYSASSSPLLLRGAPDTAWIPCRSFRPKRHLQLWVKDLPKVPTWRLERDSNPRPLGRKAPNEPFIYHVLYQWATTLHRYMTLMMMGLFQKADSLAFTPAGDEMSEVVSRYLPHRQLWWTTCPRSLHSGLRLIRTNDPSVTNHRTYRYTTASLDFDMIS